MLESLYAAPYFGWQANPLAKELRETALAQAGGPRHFGHRDRAREVTKALDREPHRGVRVQAEARGAGVELVTKKGFEASHSACGAGELA
jgi:hypothetical protein